jgi:peptidoglycan-N-acetylglucosamine deacetylase
MYRIPNIVSNLLRPWVTLRYKKSGAREVFLTFDDGPFPGNTEQILGKLRESGVKATFFLTGNRAVSHCEQVQQIRSEGHSVCSHGMEHTRIREMSMKEFTTDFSESTQLLGTTTYRPPYGKIPFRFIRWIKRHDGQIILWNVDMRDYSESALSPERAVIFICSIKPGDIILLHDNPATISSTLFFIEHIVSELQNRGIGFSKIM